MSENHKPQPPGVVLGPDGKPCKVCTAFRAWRPSGFAAAGSFQPNTTRAGAPGDTKASSPPPVGTNATAMGGREQCPPDGEQLGRATWTFLHTTAAYYPERPDPRQMRHMRSLLAALPTLYPCSHCAAHLGECMKRSPPDVSGRAGLSRWLCERHNEVNEMLGKELFDCNKTDERWKEGPPDGSCD